MRVVLMGPPGAGKGTQAVVVSAALGIPHVSTGDIFRQNVNNATELGREAQRFMDKGEYVPDDLTNAMVRDRLTQPDAAAGFLLDGYPRTTAQVDELDSILASTGHSIDCAVELTVDMDEVVGRLLKRAAEQGRSDDTDEVVRTRLQVYADQTAPLTARYGDRGLLAQVDGSGTVEEVTARVLAALAR